MKCLNCNKETKNPKFCSRRCSASYNNRGVRRHGDEPRNCLSCGKRLPYSKQSYCSHHCHQEHKYQLYIDRWLNCKEDGYLREGMELSNPVRRWVFEKSKYRCSSCGWGEINSYTGRSPLQIHHKDGDCLNARPSNLVVLCPNCHSLTENFGNLNRGRGRKKRYAGKV